MAEDKKEPKQELKGINIDVVENGFKISAWYMNAERSLAERAGWVPSSCPSPKEYVEKTKDSVLKRLKEIL